MNPMLSGILSKAPELIVIAKQLVDALKGSKRTSQVADRLSILERNELQQAELIRDMARQISDISVLIRSLSVKITICLICSVVALLLSLGLLLGQLTF